MQPHDCSHTQPLTHGNLKSMLWEVPKCVGICCAVWETNTHTEGTLRVLGHMLIHILSAF